MLSIGSDSNVIHERIGFQKHEFTLDQVFRDF